MQTPCPRFVCRRPVYHAAVHDSAIPHLPTGTGTYTTWRFKKNGAYSVVAQVRAKPGKEDALRAATLPLIALVRGDPQENLV